MSSCSFFTRRRPRRARRRRRATLFGGHLVEHRQVVEALPELLDAAQLALGVGQLAGDLLGARLVVPQIRIGGLVLQLLDAAAQPLDIEHPLHRGQGGVECGDIGLTVGIHGSSGYRLGSSVAAAAGSAPFSIGAVTSSAATRQPLARGRAATESCDMRPYHVAIVGSGPSGYFAAASLLKFADATDDADVRVDMLEMLPTPWGLVRSGVAPDHPKIKSISAQFEKTALDPRFRFFGNIVVGDHVQAAELAERYDAVIYAVGAQSDRSLGIPGEDLPGSVAAVDFVGWYNAHPHFEEMAPDLSSGRAVVVGNGNVALDVARILVTDPDVLAATDIADHALQSLHDRGVEEVADHRAARPAAGPVHHAGAARARRPRGPRRRRRDRRPRRLRRHLRRGPRGRGQDRQEQHQGAARLRRTRAGGRQAPDRVPVPHLADRDQGRRRVESIVLGRNELVDDNGRIVAKDTGEREEVPAQLVVRAVGYRGVPTPGLPFDDAAAPSRTPPAGSTAAATSTSSAGSNAGPPG